MKIFINCCISWLVPLHLAVIFPALPPLSDPWFPIPSRPPVLRGGPNRGNLQISPINHKPESNITNILQLEETAVRSEPSISSPHAPQPHHSFSRRPWRKWEGWDGMVLMERVTKQQTKTTADFVLEWHWTVPQGGCGWAKKAGQAALSHFHWPQRQRAAGSYLSAHL